MRLADLDETRVVLAALTAPMDEDIDDADHAIAVVDRFFEWFASEPADMKVQKAYAPGDRVAEWGGVPARETLARVTPAAILNSLFTSEFTAAALAFTPDGIFVVLREPHDPSG